MALYFAQPVHQPAEVGRGRREGAVALQPSVLVHYWPPLQDAVGSPQRIGTECVALRKNSGTIEPSLPHWTLFHHNSYKE